MATTGYKCGPLCGLEAGVCEHGNNWAEPGPGFREEVKAQFPLLFRAWEVRTALPQPGGGRRVLEAARVLASLPSLPRRS